MSSTIDLSFILNETDIEVSLTLTNPERYTFEDNFDLDLLNQNAEEQDILLGEYLANEIISELQRLNVHVSFEAEKDIIDQTIEFASFAEMED